jgi:hypothetical protein
MLRVLARRKWRAGWCGGRVLEKDKGTIRIGAFGSDSFFTISSSRLAIVILPTMSSAFV